MSQFLSISLNAGIYNPIAPLLAAVLALVCFVPLSYCISKTEAGRFQSIDGLRGYLALAVFVHHASVWYVYGRTGQWRAPSSPLFSQLGEGAVALFFMISAFLFFRQVKESDSVNWTRLYVGRFLRMFPLYAVALVVLVALVLYSSGFRAHESPVALLAQIARWLSFTILGAPDINGFVGTRYIMAGVVWSLPYEWAWYATLPLIGLLVRKRPPVGLLALSVAAIAFAFLKLDPLLLLPFVGGVAAYYVCGFEPVARMLRGRLATLVALSCAVASVLFFDSARHPFAVMLWTVFFSIVACGNSFFGLLSNRFSLAMGEVSYGIYLFHGFFLFLAFELIGKAAYAALTPAGHWLVCLALLPLLLATCTLIYRLIELPAMRSRSNVIQLLQSIKGRPRAALKEQRVDTI